MVSRSTRLKKHYESKLEIYLRFSPSTAKDDIIDAHFQLRVKAERNRQSAQEPIPADFFFIVNGRPTNSLLDVLSTMNDQTAASTRKSNETTSDAVAAASAEPRNAAALSTSFSTDPFPSLELPLRTPLDVSVVFVESPSEFWCQLVEEASVLEQLMDFLQLAFDQKTLTPLSSWPPKPRQAVAARFTDDDAWYRAVVTSNSHRDKAEVLFVDFGILLIADIKQYPKNVEMSLRIGYIFVLFVATPSPNITFGPSGTGYRFAGEGWGQWGNIENMSDFVVIPT